MNIEAVIRKDTPQSGPMITSDRFTLRPIRRSDAGLMTLYASDIRVAEKTTSLPHPLPPGMADNYIDRVTADHAGETALVLDASNKGGSEFLGLVALSRMDRDQSEVSYWVAPAFWNAGYASEAVQALVDANPLNNRTFFASVFQDNPRSARVLTNAGFEYLGDAEAFSVARGAKVATWTYLKTLR